MNCFRKIGLLLLTLYLFPSVLCSQYSISGQLEDSEHKYKFITLELVSSINELTGTSMNAVINRAAIDSTGHFILEGKDLPVEPKLYRLSLQKEGEGIGISTGPWKNHIHVVLHKESVLEIISCADVSKNFSFCKVKGSEENMVIQDLYDNVLQTFWDDYVKIHKTGSDLKKDLVYQSHNDFLKNYCDTSSHFFSALIAYKHIKTEQDEDYRTDSKFYNSFLNKVMDMRPNSPYAKELKKEFYTDLDILHGQKATAMSYLHWVLLFIIISCGAYIIALRKQISKMSDAHASAAIVPVETRLKSLSKKEVEVFQHIQKGKSNKEIASTLYIEVNTVKSHISKIYQKLDIKSRKEALEISL